MVLSGAGARGAFHAGALAELVPALARQGLRPAIWLGTSAGSINATLWGALAHLEPEEAARQVVDLWEQMSDDDVYRPLLPLSLPRAVLKFAGGAWFGLGSGTTSLLDTEPLRRTAEAVLQPARLAANLRDGMLSAVGVVATRVPAATEESAPGAASGRSVLFLHEHVRGEYAGNPHRALDVERGPIGVDHVLASSAIPVAFPPVRIAEPAHAAGWYVDGGVRLNTPLHPAVGLGAAKLVVVSATATTYGAAPPPDPHGSRPDAADAAAQVLNATLADRTTEDLRALRRTNRLVAQAAEAGRPGVLTDSTGRSYRGVEVMAVSPQPGSMGWAAANVWQRRTSGAGRLAELDNWILGRIIRGAGDQVGRRQLLSYLLFDEEYFAAGIALGRRQARKALARGWGY